MFPVNHCHQKERRKRRDVSCLRQVLGDACSYVDEAAHFTVTVFGGNRIILSTKPSFFLTP